jgi:hypothetical protein
MASRMVLMFSLFLYICIRLSLCPWAALFWSWISSLFVKACRDFFCETSLSWQCLTIEELYYTRWNWCWSNTADIKEHAHHVDVKHFLLVSLFSSILTIFLLESQTLGFSQVEKPVTAWCVDTFTADSTYKQLGVGAVELWQLNTICHLLLENSISSNL